jgi:hypothetical protein
LATNSLPSGQATTFKLPQQGHLTDVLTSGTLGEGDVALFSLNGFEQPVQLKILSTTLVFLKPRQKRLV